jgi:hypothetical protein
VAADALEADPDALTPAAASEFYTVFGNGSERGVAVVDERGAVPLAERGAALVEGEGEGFVERLAEAVEEAQLNLGVVSMLPRVTVLAGPCLLDLSDAKRADDVLAGAREAIAEHPGPAIAIVAR